MFEISYTLRLVLLGTLMLGVSAGMLGTFLVLRSQALMGDALSHSALPGVMLAYIISGVRDLQVLLIGAFLSALLATALLEMIKRYTTIKFDASMALILAGFFGFGQVLLSHIQTGGAASQAGLSTFVLGQAATMLRADIVMIAWMSAIVLFVIALFYKELKLFVFDGQYFKVIMRHERIISVVLNAMVVFVIVIGIRMVGVILMSALLIAPGVAARQLSNRLWLNLVYAGIVGGVSGIIGAFLSARISGMPTGPAIAVVLGVIVIIALLFSPKKGLVRHFVFLRRFRRSIHTYKPLIHMYEKQSPLAFDHAQAERFCAQGLIQSRGTQWSLTHKGETLVRRIMGEWT